MKPGNAFKEALAQRRVQIGLWLSMADPYLAEVSATVEAGSVFPGDHTGD